MDETIGMGATLRPTAAVGTGHHPQPGRLLDGPDHHVVHVHVGQQAAVSIYETSA
jgi:hypothetical protein